MKRRSSRGGMIFFALAGLYLLWAVLCPKLGDRIVAYLGQPVSITLTWQQDGVDNKFDVKNAEQLGQTMEYLNGFRTMPGGAKEPEGEIMQMQFFFANGSSAQYTLGSGQIGDHRFGHWGRRPTSQGLVDLYESWLKTTPTE